ncbi:SDR family NAD(P)-dependent oxidoreductase [Nocardia suismassiliense]|uniref:SDR family NAD(P)-dependent oxidoreductase n=1 Tax=Nocardia suismassiliense TaxID=2077092 RepID=A0ABW6QTU7_9NOCA
MSGFGASQHGEDIAVVGVGLRLPGGIADLDGLWAMLSAGRDVVTEIPADRFDAGRIVTPGGRRPGKSYTAAAGMLTGVDIAAFDARFFGISPREAGRMDPQQRILLELAMEALDDAAVDMRELSGSDTGVFIGISEIGYATQQNDWRNIDAYTNSGLALSIAANRISHFFDFRGPSMAIDTACSSAMVALHQACQALRSGEGRVMLAGGMSILLSPFTTVGFAQASMLSPTGRCRAFSADADGYVRAEGGGLVVLKRLADAVADGDRVHAVIRGTGVNCDGRTPGLALPSATAQEALLRKVYAMAGVEPHQVGYVEAHGTGTPAGDPVECAALGRALGMPRSAGPALPIGSVKTNLGHLEAASGMAGLLKAILVLRHRVIPASLHATPLNPAIDFDGLRLAPVRESTPLDSAGPAVVGVNSFGFGGANAHAVLAEAPQCPSTARPAGRPLPLVVSARSADAVTEAARLLGAQLADATAEQFYDACYTLTRRRTRHWDRVAVLAADGPSAAARLREIAEGAVDINQRASETARGQVAFVFSGNGSQWAGMAADLLADPVFGAVIAAVDARLRPRLGWSVADELSAPLERSRMSATEVAQPALFAVQLGLAEMLRNKGVEPAAVVGHSVGEVAAAYLAGALDLDAACLVIAERSAAQARTAGRGRMAAVGMSAAEIARELDGLPGVELAGINSRKDVTVSGDSAAVAELGSRLAAREIFFRELELDYPFHSKAMDDLQDTVRAGLADLAPGATRMPLISAVTGTEIPGTELGAEYWWRNVREPVLFAPAVEELITRGFDIFVEIGPHPVLRGYLRRLTAAVETPTAVVPTLLRSAEGARAVDATVERLLEAGASLDSARYFPDTGQVVDLPRYPWQRERHWQGSPESSFRNGGDGTIDHPLLGERLSVLEPTWRDVVEPTRVPWLTDHRVGGAVVMPASAFLEMALAAGRRVHDAAVEVTDLQITHALVLAQDYDGPPVGLQVSLSETSGVVRIASRVEGMSEWQANATGRVRRLWHPQPAPIDIAGERACLTEKVSGAEHYAATAAVGLDYGPAFQVLEELTVGRDHVLAAYRIDAAQSGYEVHPALLDGALQAGAPLLADARHVFLPHAVGITHRWFQPPATGCILVRSRARHQDYVRWDITITDVDGAVAMELRDVWLRRFDAALGAPVDQNVCVLRAAPYEEAPMTGTPMPAAGELAVATAQRLQSGKTLLETPTNLMRTTETLTHHAVAALTQLLPTPAAFAEEDALAAGMLPKYAGLFDLLLSMACAYGLAEPMGEKRWRWTGAAAPEPLLRCWLAEVPECAPAAALGTYAARRLPEFLCGRADPMQEIVLDGGSLLEQYYDVSPDARYHNEILRAALSEIVLGWPEDRSLRVLEVGAGTGATTAALLPLLPPERTHYLFTDASTSFFTKAQKRFAAYDFVEYRQLDLDEELAAHGFSDCAFDLIVASNALHTAADLACSMRSLGRLLAAGGLLLASERHDPQPLALPFGVLDSFWGFTDTALRTHSPLLSREQWPALLRRCGFADVRQLGSEQEPLRSSSSVILATRAAETALGAALPPAALGSRWILLAEDDTELEFAASLAERLHEAGGSSVHAIVASELIDGWLPAVAENDSVRVIFLLSAATSDAQPGPAATTHRTLRRVAVLRAIAAGLRDLPSTVQTRCCLVTRPTGAMPAPERAEVPEDAALWGAARSLANEQPALGLTRVSLARGPQLTESADRLARELLTPTDEDEVVLTPAGRFVPRVVAAAPELTMVAADNPQPYRLALHNPGLSCEFSWQPSAPKQAGPQEVVIAVRAAALNYRDVLQAVGMLPPEVIDGTFAEQGLGFECAGVITEVGAQVRDLRPGDRVYGLAPAALAAQVVTAAENVGRIPDGLSFTGAATLPVAASTVYYALETLARLVPGEVLLVHGGAGGVGLAAVRYAEQLGVTVIATAGSAIKREFLRSLGVQHVFDSRSMAFVAEVEAATGGRGVDVVLNSLAGEALHRSLELLRPHGRFVELGKRDVIENSPLLLRALQRNISVFCADLSTMDSDHPVLGQVQFRTVAEQIASQAYPPLPHTVYPAARIGEAFRLLQHSRHIGKVVVTFDGEVPVERMPVPVLLDPDATYVVTGGTSGLGAATARWLAGRGARHVVLTSRSGPAAPEAAKLVDELTTRGATVTAYAADVTDLDAMRAVFATIDATGHPVRGVVHAAMRLDDAPLAELDDTRFDTALAPKMQGALTLAELVEERSLDFFVLFSSVAAMAGQLGQANYVAGNLFVEAFARHRLSNGLTGQAVAWGAIGDVGHVARTGLADRLSGFGMLAISAEEAMTGLEQLLGSERNGVSVARMDWDRMTTMLPSLLTPRFARVRPPAIHGMGQGKSEFLRELAAATPEEAQELVQQAMIGLVAHVMQTTPDRIDPHRQLDQLGLDSLMAAELLAAIRHQLGCELSVMDVARGGSLAQLSRVVLAAAKPSRTGS